MLYITTGNPADSFTAHRVLRENKASDGGMFIPMQMPTIPDEKICAMKNLSFSEVVAQVLNLFFDKQISGWDVGFSVGRSPLKVLTMNHRLVVAQLWHNHGGAYCHLENNIYQKLTGILPVAIPEWPKIAIRIAVLFGVHSELAKDGIHKYDIAVSTDDFLLPVAAWYAQKMGLPVEKIICGCSENSGIWDLIHRGEFSTASVEAHNLFAIERLVFDAFGRAEALRYREAMQRRGIYKLSEENQQILGSSLFASVASPNRLEGIIRSVFRTNNYILDFDAASAYGALQDFRARTGESRPTLILMDQSPAHSCNDIGRIIGLSGDELKKKFHTQKE